MTNTILFAEEVEKSYTAAVEFQVSKWRKKRDKATKSKDEVDADVAAMQSANPADMLRDLVGLLVEKKLEE